MINGGAATAAGTISRGAGEQSVVEHAARPGEARITARIAGALTLAVGAVAVVVHLTVAAAARDWLAFPFAGIPAQTGEAAAIFLHNLRALAAIAGLLLLAQAPHWTQGTSRGAVQRTLQRAGEVVIATIIAGNVLVVGAGLGAYGIRMIRASLPHGPLELVAYSVALGVYLQGRNQQLRGKRVVLAGAVSVSTLAVAAALEVFVNL